MEAEAGKLLGGGGGTLMSPVRGAVAPPQPAAAAAPGGGGAGAPGCTSVVAHWWLGLATALCGKPGHQPLH